MNFKPAFDDRVGCYLWKVFPERVYDAKLEIATFQKQASEAASKGDIWLQRRMLQMAAEWCHLGHYCLGFESEEWDKITEECLKALDEFDYDLLKKGVKVIEQRPRPTAMTVEEAQSKAQSTPSLFGINEELISFLVRGYSALSKGAYYHAVHCFKEMEVELERLRASAVYVGFLYLNQICQLGLQTAIFQIRESERWTLFVKLYEEEGEFWRCSDEVARRVTVGTCLRSQRFSYLNQVYLVKDAVIKLIDLGYYSSARECCKRYLSLVKAATAMNAEWSNESAKESTKVLLENFDKVCRSVRASQNAINVSMTMASKSKDEVDTSVYEAMLSSFKKSSLPSPDRLISLATAFPTSLTDFSPAPSKDHIFAYCPSCTGFQNAEARLVPTAGYQAGIACSIGLLPFVIGIVPLVALLAAKPCHDVKYCCLKCSRMVVMD